MEVDVGNGWLIVDISGGIRYCRKSSHYFSVRLLLFRSAYSLLLARPLQFGCSRRKNVLLEREKSGINFFRVNKDVIH